jgi:LysM domain-containing protein
MPDFKPNYFVRAFALIALVAALVLVVVVVITSAGGSGSNDEKSGDGKPKISKVGRRALKKGVWVVQSGDTLGAISVKTGVDQDTLLQLNPDLDPQALAEGEQIRLR